MWKRSELLQVLLQHLYSEGGSLCSYFENLKMFKPSDTVPLRQNGGGRST